MTKAPNRPSSLLRGLGVAGPARVRALQGTGEPKMGGWAFITRASTPTTPALRAAFARLGRVCHGRPRGPPARFLAAPLALLITLATLLFAFASVAQAEAPRLISAGSFPATLPEGVAVDNSGGASSGDVYVAALFSANINKFDGSVPPSLLSPSPFGEGAFSGAAVNPTNGDVYVLTALGQTAIDTYDPNTGVLLSSFEVPPSGNLAQGQFTIVQIGVDSAGNVYVPVAPQNEVLEYKPSECPALPEPCTLSSLKTFTGGSGSGALKGPTGVAVDSAGDLWVADSGDNRIEELNQKDEQITEIKSEGVQDAIALDGHGDVFTIVKNGADFCGSVRVAVFASGGVRRGGGAGRRCRRGLL